MALIPLGRIPTLRAAQPEADRWAVRYGTDVLTWRALETLSTRRAWALQDAGIRQGDLVTLAVPNGVAFFEILFALWKIGATPHVVSGRLPIHEMKAITELARPKLVIASSSELTDAFNGKTIDFGAAYPRTDPLPEAISNPWKVMTSGGSTGRPKLIVHTAPSVFDPDAPDMLHLPKQGPILSTGPLYHNMPLITNVLALCRGLQIVGMAKFDPEEALRLVETYRVTWSGFVPTMMMRISRLPQEVRARYELSSIETVWHWAAPMPPALKQEWMDWLGAENVWELYGGTEAYCTTTLNGKEWLAHRGSVGRPVADKIKIIDEDGNEVPSGTVGAIYALPPTGQGSTYRYIGAESRSIEGGYETLGDYGWLDDEGYLYIADRRTDMIVSGGANIYPAEVESALMAHPGVEAAVVIGLPHDDLGAAAHAIVKAAVNWEHRIDQQTLIDFLRGHLTPYKIPRTFEFTAESLRDDAGKVRRLELREARIKNPLANGLAEVRAAPTRPS